MYKRQLLRILSGALEPTTGSVTMGADDRMSVLEQDHFKYDEYNVMDTVIMGNRRLYDIMKEKEALYAKEDFTLSLIHIYGHRAGRADRQPGV